MTSCKSRECTLKYISVQVQSNISLILLYGMDDEIVKNIVSNAKSTR